MTKNTVKTNISNNFIEQTFFVPIGRISTPVTHGERRYTQQVREIAADLNGHYSYGFLAWSMKNAS